MATSGLDPHQSIYRFLTFFDLYKLVKDKQLRFTSLHKLDDKNEGLGKILRSIELSLAFQTDLVHLMNVECPIIKHTTYVSCWTTVPDNVAMWILYSPDKSGMRIKTTVAKLYAVLETYQKEYPTSINKIENVQPSQIDVFRMDYKDLRQAKKTIEENKNTAITAMRKAINGKPKPDALRAWYKTMRKHLKDNVLDNDTMKYKDKNYSHEQEIRGQIEFEPTTEDQYDYMTCRNFEGFPNFIWLTVGENFLEEICIDPRCLDYREEIFREIIDPKGKMKFVKSEAFGAVL